MTAVHGAQDPNHKAKVVNRYGEGFTEQLARVINQPVSRITEEQPDYAPALRWTMFYSMPPDQTFLLKNELGWKGNDPLTYTTLKPWNARTAI